MTENERVREIRKAKSLTLEEFGKRLGVGKTAISKIESGDRSLTDQMCRSICREFNVNEEWLRTGKEPMFVQRGRDAEIEQFFNNVLSEERDSFRRRFIAALCRLDVEQWKMAEQFITTISESADESAPELDIEAEVEAYRQQLLEEKRAAAGLSASQNDTAENAG